MANFEEEYKQAREKGKTDSLVTDIWAWEEEGQLLIGRLVDILPFTEGKFNTEVNKYIIETDDGRVSTVLGAATDKAIATKARAGVKLAIRYKGQKALPDGKHVNRFEVDTW